MKRTKFFLVISMFLGLSLVVSALPQKDRPLPGGSGQTEMFGQERLVSIEPLPAMDGQLSLWPESTPKGLWAEASAPENLMALLQQQSGAAGAAVASSAPPRPSEAARAEVARRQPLNTIRDPRNVFAGVAVDPIRNEIIVADENNFSVLVYDRTTNTPPGAVLSEPKRVIGGDNTFIEYACDVYVDPSSGDIYVINNDTLTWLTVWDRNARGNMLPTRKFAVPYSVWAIAVDEETEDLMLTVQEDNAVVTFKKTARDNDPPVRLLQGANTQLADPHGIALDPTTDLIYVTNWGIHYDREPGAVNTGLRTAGKPLWPVGSGEIAGSGEIRLPSITVYRKDAAGDAAPLRVIQGPGTQLNWPSSIAVHPDRGEIFVANDTGPQRDGLPRGCGGRRRSHSNPERSPHDDQASHRIDLGPAEQRTNCGQFWQPLRYRI